MTSAVLIREATRVVAQVYRNLPFSGEVPEGFYVEDVEHGDDPPPTIGDRHEEDGVFTTPPPHPDVLSDHARRLARDHLRRGAEHDGHRFDATDQGRTRLSALKADAEDEGEGFRAFLDTLDGASIEADPSALAAVTAAVVKRRSENRTLLAKALSEIGDGTIVTFDALTATFDR